MQTEQFVEYDENGNTIPYEVMWCPNCQMERMYIEGRFGPLCSVCFEAGFSRLNLDGSKR